MQELSRSQKSETFLSELGIPINPSLPAIEDEADAHIRTPQEVAQRILVLANLSMYAESGEIEEILEYMKSEGLWEAVSELEKSLFEKPELTRQDSINISWRAEGIYFLMWSLGYFVELGLPMKQCDVGEIIDFLPPFFASTSEFINEAELRPTSEILDQSDLIYRIHWATRQAQIEGTKIPANLIPGIVEEWHYAVNWLTYQAENWDEVTTDT